MSKPSPSPTTKHSTPPGPERRATVRQACNLDTACQPLMARKDDTAWTAHLVDVSLEGLGLVLSRRFEPGTILSLEVPGACGSLRTLLGRVVNVRAMPDRTWRVGCRLINPLTDEDLQALR